MATNKINTEQSRLLLTTAKRYREKSYEIDALRKGIIEKAKEIEYELNKNWQGKIIRWPEKPLFRNSMDQYCYEILYVQVNAYYMLNEYYFDDNDQPFLQAGKIPVEIHMYNHGNEPRLIKGKGIQEIRKSFKKFEENSDRNRYIYYKPHSNFYQKWKSSSEISFNNVVCTVADLQKKL